MNTKAIIFDFDDTLVKTMKVRVEAMIHAAKSLYGITLTKEQVLQEWGKPFDIMLATLFGGKDSVSTIKEKYFPLITKSFPSQAENGAHEIISYLKQKFILCIITSASHDIFSLDFANAGFSKDTFYHIQTASDTNVHKPDPRVFVPTVKVLENMHIYKDECVYIGDNINDYMAATSAGIPFIAITTGITSREEFEKHTPQPVHIIDSLKQLQDIF